MEIPQNFLTISLSQSVSSLIDQWLQFPRVWNRNQIFYTTPSCKDRPHV